MQPAKIYHAANGGFADRHSRSEWGRSRFQRTDHANRRDIEMVGRSKV